MMKHLVLVAILLAVIAAGCISDRSSPNDEQAFGSEVNIDSNIVKEGDLFPEKVEVEYSSRFSVEYYDSYKVVTVNQPWRGAEESLVYLLVQRGTSIPDGYEEATVFEIPVEGIVTISTTYLPHLEILGVTDHLKGHKDIRYVNSPYVLEMVEDGSVVEVGGADSINLEVIMDIDPDVVMTYATGNPAYDVHPKLEEVGLDVVINADYMEEHPLGRTEWVKFTSLFFNKEHEANLYFDEVVTEYEYISSLADQVEDKPTVFSGVSWQGTWYTPGGKSYAARLMEDAGASYLWSEDNSSGSMTLGFESVYDRSLDADYWIDTGIWSSLDEAKADDERYFDFVAAKSGNVYNNNRRVNEWGGNDYHESGIVHPEDILADMVKIFHPELLPEHEFVYYQQLAPLTGGTQN